MSDTTEMYYAEMEAARNTSETAYFDARPEFVDDMTTKQCKRMFREGFERAFKLLWQPDKSSERQP